MRPSDKAAKVAPVRKSKAATLGAPGKLARPFVIAEMMDSQTIESDEELESAALAADGDGVWEQAYCVVCDCLIEPQSTNVVDNTQWEFAAVSPLRIHSNALRAPKNDDECCDREKRVLYCSDKCRETDSARSTGFQELVHYMEPGSSVGSQASVQRPRSSFLANSIAFPPQQAVAKSVPVCADTTPLSKFRPTSLKPRQVNKAPIIKINTDIDTLPDTFTGSLAFDKQPLSPLQLGHTLSLNAPNTAVSNLQRTWAQHASRPDSSSVPDGQQYPELSLSPKSGAPLSHDSPVQMRRAFSHEGTGVGTEPMARSFSLGRVPIGSAMRAEATHTPESGVAASTRDFSPRESQLTAVEQLKQTQARDSPRRSSTTDSGEGATFLRSLSSVWTSVVGSPDDFSATQPTAGTRPDDASIRRERAKRSINHSVEVLPPVYGTSVDHTTSASTLSARSRTKRTSSQLSFAKWHATEDAGMMRRPITPLTVQEQSSRSGMHLSPGGANPSGALCIPGTSPRRAGLGWSALPRIDSDRKHVTDTVMGGAPGSVSGSATNTVAPSSLSSNSSLNSRNSKYGQRAGEKMYPILQLPGEVHDTYTNYWDHGHSPGGRDSHRKGVQRQEIWPGRRKTLFHFDGN